MIFNSWTFILFFLPPMLLGWWWIFNGLIPRLGGPRWLGGATARLTFLALMSYVFYAYHDNWHGVWLLPLLIGSTLTDFVGGHLINRREDGDPWRKRFLIITLTVNLVVLGIFKYLGFFEGTLNGLASLVGLGGGNVVPVHDIVLPIGISFYTFNSMSYTIDIYRRRVKPARNILHYSAFVALFPHLVAGPIVRYSDIDEQLANLHRRFTSQMAAIGIFFFVCGLFKKLVIADVLFAPYSDRLYANSEALTVISGWAAALAYAFQLYFDFSAYSDMAVGLAMFMGFRFPQNFNSPYKALNPSDFWRRWHMSLSNWLRDYLFISLGGSRVGKIFTLRNLFITMFLGGLWHGAGWVFVIWGVGHGLLLVVHALARDAGLTPRNQWVNRSLMFGAAVILWVPFRSGELTLLKSGQSFDVMMNMLGAMFGANGLGLAQVTTNVSAAGAAVPVTLLASIVVGWAWCNFAPNTWEVKLTFSRPQAVALGFMGACSLLLLAAPSPFLYFQF